MVLARCLCFGTEECMAMRRTVRWCNPPTQCQTNTCLLSRRSRPLFSVTSCIKGGLTWTKDKANKKQIKSKGSYFHTFPMIYELHRKAKTFAKRRGSISIAIIANCIEFHEDFKTEDFKLPQQSQPFEYEDKCEYVRTLMYELFQRCSAQHWSAIFWWILIKAGNIQSKQLMVQLCNFVQRQICIWRVSAHHLHNNNKAAAHLQVTGVVKCHILIPILFDETRIRLQDIFSCCCKVELERNNHR